MSAILQFCQSTTLRGFSPMVQYLGSVHLEINKSTAKKSIFKNFSVCPISPILSIYKSTQFFTYGTIFSICTFLTYFKKISVCQISPILSIYESTRFFPYGTIFRICTFGNQQINSKKIHLCISGKTTISPTGDHLNFTQISAY